jgi:UDP-N-acetylmuramate dehydrogenase
VLRVREDVDLAGYTTLRLGGPAARFADVDSGADLIEAVRVADEAGEPLLVLGGGSNLVVADDGFPGTVLRVATSGVAVTDTDGGVRVTAAAGENWAEMVDWAVSEKLAGIECLAGIPGLAGATPMQNVGAYGQEVASTITAVRVFDRDRAAVRTFAPADCGFGYRTSIFKRARPGGRQGRPAGRASDGVSGGRGEWPTGRYVVLEVTFELSRDPMSEPVRYAELASKLGISSGDQAPVGDVRDAVLELRRGKGMVLDPDDPDTASVGSFFTNPVFDQVEFAALEHVASALFPGVRVPRFAAAGGQVKVPAAWLIERAGFRKGHRGPGGARISSKHTLALINQGGGSTADVIALAREVVAGVLDVFGVKLINEPVLVGVQL